MTKTEILRRLRQLIAATKQHEGLPANARLQIGYDEEGVATNVAPTDADVVTALVDQTEIDGYVHADHWVKRCGRAGAVVTMYFEVRASDGEYELDTVAVGWIGTDEAAPVLMLVDGTVVLRTMDAPVKADRPARRSTPAAPTVDLAPKSMTRDDLIAEFNELLDQFGLRERGWTAHVNERMTRTYGICRYRSRRVEISWQIARLNGRESNLDTIRHEVAHAIVGPGCGHGPKWKEACELTGARPVRCYSGDEVATPEGRWLATCEACGENVGTRARAPKSTSYWHAPKHCSAAVPGRKSYIRWTDTRG